MNRSLRLAWLLLLSQGAASAQDLDPDFGRLSVSDGLPHASVYAIFQDSRGFMWFGTRGVAVAVAPDLPVVFGDRARLLEVMQNLVENAVKFMGDQAAPRIEIASRQEAGETVLFVRDNGEGIDAKYQERIFELFERLDSGTEGTGIGLALVKRIVTVHGGRVRVESGGEGHGSTFCLTLRLAAAPDHPSATRAAT